MCVCMCVVVQLVRASQRHCAVLVFELIRIDELGSQGEKRKKDILATFPHEYTVLCPSGILLQNHVQTLYGISSVQFSCSVVSDSLRPHESQHARPFCPSPTPRVHWDSHPSSQCGPPAISSSVVPISSWPQSLPASESFPMSQLFAWGGQSTGVSALASFLWGQMENPQFTWLLIIPFPSLQNGLPYHRV